MLPPDSYAAYFLSGQYFNKHCRICVRVDRKVQNLAELRYLNLRSKLGKRFILIPQLGFVSFAELFGQNIAVESIAIGIFVFRKNTEAP